MEILENLHISYPTANYGRAWELDVLQAQLGLNV